MLVAVNLKVNVYVKIAENVGNGMLVIKNVLANLVKIVENIIMTI